MDINHQHTVWKIQKLPNKLSNILKKIKFKKLSLKLKYNSAIGKLGFLEQDT